MVETALPLSIREQVCLAPVTLRRRESAAPAKLARCTTRKNVPAPRHTTPPPCTRGRRADTPSNWGTTKGLSSSLRFLPQRRPSQWRNKIPSVIPRSDASVPPRHDTPCILRRAPQNKRRVASETNTQRWDAIQR